ncbi:ComEA family DNA-binding protein [Desertivirga xinjiangensis]|uniref:ComEA family DNA-binding protein n=1 Tax=Desertivirga xinjiangensis TaxID=539206 RepID=UPI00210E0CAF|nr:helix-hairpin-helix domain-containing protein [Pedobacter xinjiangensis]
MKESLKEFLSFTKKELNGLIIFCFLLLLIALAPYIYAYFNPPQVYRYDEFEKEVNAFKESARENSHRSYPGYSKKKNETVSKPVYFKFDPNNLPEQSWKKLGLSDKQIRVINNYRSKGGRFYEKEDLKKIYSISLNDYLRLKPYINIPPKSYAGAWEKKRTGFTGKKEMIMIELNSADSAQLESLKGIGPAFASRIVKYRDRVGGFYRKEQLMEVYGLDSSRFAGLKNQVTVNGQAIRKLNINAADFDDLKRYPFLKYKQINAIIQYRTQHGLYKSAADLKNVVLLNEDLINRLSPYLEF